MSAPERPRAYFLWIAATAAAWFIGGRLADEPLRSPLVISVFVCMIGTAVLLLCWPWRR